MQGDREHPDKLIMSSSTPVKKTGNFKKLRDTKDRMTKVAKPRHPNESDGRSSSKGDKFYSKVVRTKKGDERA